MPKGAVLLADVMPAFATKLVAPYFIHRVPYWLRVLVFAAISSLGMFIIALTPADRSVAAKMTGVILASLSSGGGELSFLGLTHFYGHMSLAAWGSGTGAAGIVGAGLYVLFTDAFNLSVQDSLFTSAFLPIIMIIAFFAVLPMGPLREGKTLKGYDPVPGRDRDVEQNDNNDVYEYDHDDDRERIEGMPPANAASSLLAPGPGVASTAISKRNGSGGDLNGTGTSRFANNLRRARALFIPYMLPLFLVYVAEYTINQGIAPVLLFPVEESPFNELRDFYPMYGFLYQLGVFVSRTSIAWVRVRQLYLPSFLQVGNVVLLALHALFDFLPNVYVVFLVVFWEGLLGGAVYVNTFADIMEEVPPADREFSLSATSVSDSAGICVAGFLGMAMEVWLCGWQVRHGRDWCKQIGVGD